MTSVSNISSTRQSFRLKDGKRATLAPGESKNLALLNRDAPDIVGREVAGVIAVEDGKAAKPKAPARDSAADNPST